MREKKKELRMEVSSRNVSAGSPPSERRSEEAGCSALIDRIESLHEFTTAHTVALYHALADEVSTSEMLRRWRGIKRLALPVVNHPAPTGHPSKGGEPPTLSMFFREYTGESNLGAGAFGIHEPVCGVIVPPTEIDLMIVPGVAFDAAGRRLGRGGGFYDRYLAQPDAAHIYKVGLCRFGALVAEVPAEAHDVAMDIVITN